MKSLVTDLKRLMSSLPRSHAEVEKKLAEIAALHDVESVGLLLECFDDGCQQHEIMFSIIHAIEQFEDSSYARKIVASIRSIWPKNKYWATVIHMRIFNSPKTLDAYRGVLRSASTECRSSVKELLQHIKESRPKFALVCDDLLDLCSGQANQ